MLPVLIYLANSKGTQVGRLRVVVCTYSGVKVAKEEKVIAIVDVFDGVVQVGVELVSCLRSEYRGGEAAGILIPCRLIQPSSARFS